MPVLYLYDLHCNAQEDWTGSDDVYLKEGGTKIWGREPIKKGETKSVNKFLPFQDKITIRLYEYDIDSPDDFLGENTAETSEVGEPRKKWNFTRDDADYTLEYQVKAE